MNWEAFLGLISFVPPVKKWILRPRLEIMLPDNEIFDVADEETKKGLGLFVHLVISNQGRSDAHGVVGFLTDVEKVPERKDEQAGNCFENVRGFRNPVQLKWSHEPFGEGYKPKTVWVDKAGRRPTRLDLCYIYLDEREFHLFTEHGPRGQALQFGPGTYRLTVLVTWDTGQRGEKKFIVYYNGNWREFGITEDSYGNNADKAIDDQNRIVSKCKKLISDACSRYKEQHLEIIEGVGTVARKVPETLGTSTNDRLKK